MPNTEAGEYLARLPTIVALAVCKAIPIGLPWRRRIVLLPPWLGGELCAGSVAEAAVAGLPAGWIAKEPNAISSLSNAPVA